MIMEFIVNVSPEFEKAKKFLNGMIEFSEFATDEQTAILIQNNCKQALKNIENIMQLLKLNTTNPKQ